MKKILLLITIGFLCINLFSQSSRLDTIVKIGGKKIAVKIIKADSKGVFFSMPGMKQKLFLEQSKVEKIIYADSEKNNVAQNKTTNTEVKENTKTNTTKKPTGLVSDTIYKINKTKLVVSNIKINDLDITYNIKGKKDIQKILKVDVDRICYNSGIITSINSNDQPKKDVIVTAEKLDTIVKLGGKKLIVNMVKVNVNDVYYKLPGAAEMKTMLIKDIEKIIYDNGRLEEYNRPVLQMLDENSWEAVLLTETPGEVDGLYKRGLITATSSSDTRNTKAAKKNATIRVQKKAAAMKANVVLVTKQEIKGGYGEIPGYYIEGIAYGFEPLPDSVKVEP